MRTPTRGAPPDRPPAGRAGRTAARTLTAAAAVLLALSGALTATAKDTQISLEVTGDELVLVGGTHTLDITATKTADDPSNPIGCVEVVAPAGWSGLTIVAGTQPTTGWSADDGPPATWSADNGGGKLQYLGEAAEVEVSATAPGAPETGTWTVTLYDSVTCADTPIMSAEFDVDVVTSLAELDVVPASATVTTGATHQVAFTAEWIASDGDEIGCIAVTLPSGWTGIGTTGMGSPGGWSSSTMSQVIVWKADTAGDVIDATGESASFTVTATAPGTAGDSDWTVAVFAAIDCSGDPILTGAAEVVLEDPPVEPDAELTIVPASATVTTGDAHQVAFTASWIASDGDEIGCIAVTLPSGWTGIGTSGMGAPAGWSSGGTGQVITWSADTAGDVIDATGESATFTVAATAPGTAGDSDWTAAVYAAIDCSGEPLLTGTADVTLVAPVNPEADLEMTPAAATITVGTTHDVDVVATWVAGEGDGIGCVVVTLPAGWTALGLTDGLPAGWTGTVDGATLMVMWQADTAEDRLLLPGDAASFTVTATAPGTAGSGTFDGEAFEALDCTGEPFVLDAALVTWVAAPSGGGDGGDGGDDTPAVLATDPEVLATDPPVPGLIPAGEGPAPLTQRTGTAMTL
ncbi:MAG: hypothetical protein RLZZ353_1264, partial [Actinomycetota bacterium]